MPSVPAQCTSPLADRVTVRAQCRPLPDERPRASQTKRHVTSQTKQREKREWPPKPRPSSTSSPSIADQLSRFSDGGLAKSPPTATVAAADTAPSSPKTAVPVLKPLPTRQSSTGTTTTGRPSTAGGTTRTPARSSTQSPPTAYHPSPSTSASTPAKAPRPSSRASHTTPAKPRPSSRASHTTPAPLKTPSRPKTPSMRPKTPSQTTVATPASARPKTPSSGLFAPTAASLARARNTQPVPTPAKKSTANTGVMERLSKPTAASLSKARIPTPAATTTRGSPASRAATEPATEPEDEHAEIPVDFPEYDHQPEHEQEEQETLSSPVQAHEHDGSESTLIDEPQHASAALTDDPDVHAAADETVEVILNSKEEELAEYGIQDTSAEEALEEAVPKPDETVVHEEGVPELPAAADAEHHEEAVQAEDHIDAQLDEPTPSEAERAGSTTPEGHDANAHVNGKSTPTPGGGSELEDILNMLEAKPRPMSIATIPDEFDLADDE
ncbi:uncharacterized protein C8Q71DRAFT_798901 [Rhodofomes roseus]|uniref:Uncharacterized protein n=1 Tax=Rhodofomes roseus TaxID=34475 RepID=A0ABQ8K523_9APHY|nr:uncharacterized protein C8Q71DRAFT_798901 [Rhodofomes roseus]KAH9831597.1 hypothetical protein C8Q71DRAFT_798901 [Rhodofomes roseus]